MTVRDIPIANKDQETTCTLHFDQISPTAFAITQMAADGVILTTLAIVSFSFVALLRNDIRATHYYSYIFTTIATTVTMVLSFACSSVYDVFNPLDQFDVLKVTAKRLVQVILLVTGCFFALKISDDFSRLWLGTWSTASAIALCAFRLVTASAKQSLVRGRRLTRNVAIVGATELGQQLAAKLVEERSGTRIVGLFDQRRSRIVRNRIGNSTVHQLSALEELLSRGRVDEIVIAIPSSASVRILELARYFHPFAVSLTVLAPEGYEHFPVVSSRQHGNIGTLQVISKPMSEVAVVLKLLEDMVIALCCLLVALPFMLLIAFSIKLDSRGPILFRQKRLGANNLPFDLLKFRSMYVERTDPAGHRLTRANDPRITRIGRLLRKTSLDELPQLFNVLRGDMSLVGPRPHALAANAAGVLYAHAVIEYSLRHRVKPGITGWAQVNGWRGETTTIEQIRRRVEHDLHYIENWSLTFDLLILGRTIFAVLSRKNAV